MSPRMIIETYTDNLPFVRGFKVFIGEDRADCNMCINPAENNLVLKTVAYESLTTPVYLAANVEDYSIRHALAERLEKIRSGILKERQKCS